MRSALRMGIWFAAAMLPAGLTGCAAAAAGAAGAAAAVAYNDRGAESHVDASISSIVSAAEATFGSMGIAVTERRSTDDSSELHGEMGDQKVVVDIDRDADDAMTHVMVTVSKNMVDYDKSQAERILKDILNRL